MADKITFNARKAEITIDYSKCEPAQSNSDSPKCEFRCVKACRLYGRNLLKIENNRPVLAVTDPKEIERLENECLGCEYQCSLNGTGCITIEVPLPGIEEYRAKTLGGK